MPVKRVAWACQYGCGRNVLTSRTRMAEHEVKCSRNPENRACPSCYYACDEFLGEETRNINGRLTTVELSRHGCMLDKRPEPEIGKKNRAMVRNCPYWKSHDDLEFEYVEHLSAEFVVGNKWRGISDLARIICSDVSIADVDEIAQEIGLKGNPAYCRNWQKSDVEYEYAPAAQRMIIAEFLAREESDFSSEIRKLSDEPLY